MIGEDKIELRNKVTFNFLDLRITIVCILHIAQVLLDAVKLVNSNNIRESSRQGQFTFKNLIRMPFLIDLFL